MRSDGELEHALRRALAAAAAGARPDRGAVGEVLEAGRRRRAGRRRIVAGAAAAVLAAGTAGALATTGAGPRPVTSAISGSCPEIAIDGGAARCAGSIAAPAEGAAGAGAGGATSAAPSYATAPPPGPAFAAPSREPDVRALRATGAGAVVHLRVGQRLTVILPPVARPGWTVQAPEGEGLQFEAQRRAGTRSVTTTYLARSPGEVRLVAETPSCRGGGSGTACTGTGRVFTLAVVVGPRIAGGPSAATSPGSGLPG